MEIQGIETSEEEVRDFQRVFPDTLAAKLLAKVTSRIEMEWEEVLHDVSAREERVRAAQGALEAMKKLGEIAYQLANVNLDGEDAKEKEEEQDARTDVGF